MKIRFHDRTTPDSWVKLMTDGILLAESQSDPYLSAYDAIIIDEAHERSLNIDFLLGYLKQLLPWRPDLKLIITSATIDAERFRSIFQRAGDRGFRPPLPGGGALPAGGRPGKQDDERDLYDAIVDAVDELARLGPGDTLVFLPGEREIREAAEGAPGQRHPAHAEILPLFSRLSAQEQDRIFKPGGGQRIVLATNVAETSLTVPGIRYVVDTGLARVKRYSYRNKVEQLQVEKGVPGGGPAAGRPLRPGGGGVCIRLYDEADFNARPPFTDPEILRSSLAGVILRMKSLKLTDVEASPSSSRRRPRPSPTAMPAAGTGGGGRRQCPDLRSAGLAKLPWTPASAACWWRPGSRLPQGSAGHRRRPLGAGPPRTTQDRQQAADENKQFADENPEFLAWWKLWLWFQRAVEHKKSNKQLVENCHAHFLSYLRLREWREVHTQLHAMVTELGWKENQLPGTYEASIRPCSPACSATSAASPTNRLLPRGAGASLPHPSLVAPHQEGRQVDHGRRDHRDHQALRPLRRPHRAGLAGSRSGRSPDPAQLLRPHWEKKAMQVSGWERTTLYGMVINPKRRIHYGPLAPAEARKSSSARASSAERSTTVLPNAGPSSSTTRSSSARSSTWSTSSAARTCWWTTS